MQASQPGANVKLVIGLGNPGIDYHFTPHNAGFLALDRLADNAGATINNRRSRALTAKIRLAGQEVLLAKPETFMNLSGLSVHSLIRECGIANVAEDLLVLYDELAFPLGKFKIDQRGSANGHNGVKSISAALGTQDWIRIRIGIGKPALADGTEVKAGGKDYLLAPMRKPELALLDETLDRVSKAVEAVLTRGVSAAMNEFNRKLPESEPGPDQPKA